VTLNPPWRLEVERFLRVEKIRWRLDVEAPKTISVHREGTYPLAGAHLSIVGTGPLQTAGLVAVTLHLPVGYPRHLVEYSGSNFLGFD
jgi:hypothetical protein